MMRRFLILIVLSAGPSAAQSVMTADEFDAYTRGKTLFYGFDGIAYGVERYMRGRRVAWSFLDGDCKEGVWYPQDEQICFLYEDRPDPQCWLFVSTPNGLVARFEGDPEATELYEAEQVDEEMVCYGPDVGS
jgi:hypothetical protein